MIWLLSFALFYLTWILLSGFFTLFLLMAGAGCVLLVLFLAHRMYKSSAHREDIALRWPALLGYGPWLLKEIVKSALDVSYRILSPKLDISPTLVEFTPSQRSELGLALHANSITLTPGTITIDVAPGYMYVHSISKEGAAGLAGSKMDQRVSKLETSPKGAAA